MMLLQKVLVETRPASDFGSGGGEGGDAGEAVGVAVGSRVRCEGLAGAAELNGCLGRVVGHAGERVSVRLNGPNGRVVGVKPGNLVIVVGPGRGLPHTRPILS